MFQLRIGSVAGPKLDWEAWGTLGEKQDGTRIESWARQQITIDGPDPTKPSAWSLVGVEYLWGAFDRKVTGVILLAFLTPADAELATCWIQFSDDDPIPLRQKRGVKGTP